jgi:hypothetical protein
MQAGSLRDFAARYTAAWCSQNAAGVAAHFAPHGWLRVNGGPPAIGRDAITTVAQSFMTAFPDLQVTFDSLVILEEGAEYHWTLTGTNTGPGGTGNPVCISGFELWKLTGDGLIAESQGHFDSAAYHSQLARGTGDARPAGSRARRP